MNLGKICTFLVCVLVLGGVSGCGTDKKAENPSAKKVLNVGIVQLVEHPALDAANKGFVDGLASKGYKESQNITFDRQNAQADQSNLQTIAQRFVSNKVDLICAIATPAAQTMANATNSIPIVGTAITDYKEARLVKSDAQPGTNVTGTTDMNPVKEQIDLLLKIVPNTHILGFIYTSSEVNSQLQVAIAKKYAQAKGLKTLEATVSNVNDIQQAAQSLVGKCDAIYVPTDNVLASAMPTLANVTNQAGIPVFCGEGGMTKAGGVATLGIDYYKLGFQTGVMAADILNGKSKPADMAIQAQKGFKIIVNEEQVKKLNITIPAEIVKQVKDASK
ncbi:MAG: ABC transporter substrate-binding protein [Acidaminococcaceae bacterium]|nr:ABC transporter substrate-binding protein [Acidaminococcaceae bacterium]